MSVVKKAISKKSADGSNLDQSKKATKHHEIPAHLAKKVSRGTVHQNYREIEVIQTDGTVFKTFSTYKSNSLQLDIDVKTHPAWTREANFINVKNSEVSRFNNKFGSINFAMKK